jgi:hypothetical protein
MMPLVFRFAFLWLLFAAVLGGHPWHFPYGVSGALHATREYNSAKVFRQNHIPFHSMK